MVCFFLWEIWLWVFSAFSFSIFVQCEVNKPPTHMILVGNQRKRTTLGRGFLFPLLFLFTWWQFCIVQIFFGPKTFLHISSVFFRSLIENFPFSFLFFILLSPTLSLGILSYFLISLFWSQYFMNVFMLSEMMVRMLTRVLTWVSIFTSSIYCFHIFQIIGFWFLVNCEVLTHDLNGMIKY